jgi:hypothetical protein
MNKKTGVLLFFLGLISIVFFALPLQAEAQCEQLTAAGECISASTETPASPGREGVSPLAWGTQDRIFQNIPAVAFAGYDSTTTYNTDGSGSKYRTAGSEWFDAPIHLPSGASVERMLVDFCDNSATGDVWGWFFDLSYDIGPM